MPKTPYFLCVLFFLAFTHWLPVLCRSLPNRKADWRVQQGTIDKSEHGSLFALLTEKRGQNAFKRLRKRGAGDGTGTRPRGCNRPTSKITRNCLNPQRLVPPFMVGLEEGRLGGRRETHTNTP